MAREKETKKPKYRSISKPTTIGPGTSLANLSKGVGRKPKADYAKFKWADDVTTRKQADKLSGELLLEKGYEETITVPIPKQYWVYAKKPRITPRRRKLSR